MRVCGNMSSIGMEILVQMFQEAEEVWEEYGDPN